MDDGISDQAAINYIEEYVKLNPVKCKNVIFRKQQENKGKRNAQAYVFKNSDPDIFFTVDSDSYIYPNALEELLKPFNDIEFYVVTGDINAKNRDVNLLTRLIDIR